METWCYILIFGLLIAFGVSVVVALAWSMRSGQFNDLSAAARVLFDEREPEEEGTKEGGR